MIEIYLYTSIAPIPFATMTNKEWGNALQQMRKRDVNKTGEYKQYNLESICMKANHLV